ncbi:6-phosphofructokinase 1 [Sporosarcina newyorkensis]|uniref:Pyrophosphate--fructose 6-phosphate 1-phosphotransferase n=1 Tax=Sporosarcina newyorkensis TaxID=759851 RepID=A0A1T4YLH7_9BACL|nr:6-phosphofructokinase 1 [Sporosarcina newyorkensis]
MRGNCLIVQSGGPTAVINNSVVGIIDEILSTSFTGEILGAAGGIHGLLYETFHKLTDITAQERYRLRWTPGAALGTWRHKLSSDDFKSIIEVLRKNDVRYIFYIGGNGSMSVAKAIDEYARVVGYELIVIGIPKSIDNDLLGTDHSPGYGSAAKFLATSVLDMKMDMASYTKNSRVSIIETMGRHTGWLAGACSLAEGQTDDDSQLLIYIPEVPFDLQDCLSKIVKANHEKRNTVLVVSEGIRKLNGHLVCEEDLEYDVLGRAKLGGVAAHLKDIVEEQTGISTRSIDSSIWQRSSIVLASKTDINEAYKIGRVAWQYAMDGYTGVMISMKRDVSIKNYHITYETIPLKEMAGKERYVPQEWYDAHQNTMTNEFKEYVRPIIQGEILIPMENGLPMYKVVY